MMTNPDTLASTALSTANTFNDYAKSLKDKDVPALGMLAWFSVRETSTLTHAEFVKLVEGADAPIKTPNIPKPADVFRRACNHAKMLKVATADPDRMHNYTMRDAGYDSEFVFRRMIEERVDSKNHSLGYRVLGLATFSKTNMAATYTKDIDESDDATPYWDAMTHSIDEYVRLKLVDIPAIAIREAARRALEVNLLGTRVRPGGGVYFVSIDRADKLEALDYVINSIKDASFHILPLIDDTRQREMLKESFETEAIGEAQTLIGEISMLLNSGDTVPANTFVKIQQRYNDQKNKLSEYSTLLSDALDESTAALEMCNKQVMALFNKATD